MTTPNTQLWEVFIRSRSGLAHKHVGSLHAADATLAVRRVGLIASSPRFVCATDWPHGLPAATLP